MLQDRKILKRTPLLSFCSVNGSKEPSTGRIVFAAVDPDLSMVICPPGAQHEGGFLTEEGDNCR